MDASGRFEAINSRGATIAGARRGQIFHRPIVRCALAARSCISTLANHSFRLIVGKSAALRALSRRAKCRHIYYIHTHTRISLSLSLSVRYAPWNSSKQNAGRKGRALEYLLFPRDRILRPTSRTNCRENALITTQPSHKSKKHVIVIARGVLQKKKLYWNREMHSSMQSFYYFNISVRVSACLTI